MSQMPAATAIIAMSVVTIVRGELRSRSIRPSTATADRPRSIHSDVTGRRAGSR